MKKYLIMIASLGALALVGVSGTFATGAPEEAVADLSLEELNAKVRDQAKTIGAMQQQLDQITMHMETGSTDFPAFAGTHCEIQEFTYPFWSVPRVYVTVNHQQHRPPVLHDPVTVWIEDIDYDQFRVCVREVDSDNIHDPHVMVDWLAIY